MKTVMKRLIEHFGTQADIALALGVSFGAVSQWVSAGGMPPKRAIQIERLTKGEFKATELVGEDRYDG